MKRRKKSKSEVIKRYAEEDVNRRSLGLEDIRNLIDGLRTDMDVKRLEHEIMRDSKAESVNQAINDLICSKEE